MLLVFVVIMVMPVYGSAEVLLRIESSEIIVNNVIEHLTEGSEPRIVNGRAIVPLRAVIEALGGIVVWDSDLMLITIRDYFDENEIIMKINSYDSVVNARSGPRLEVAPKLVGNVTMVPISFVSHHLGFELDWNDENRTIKIVAEN